MELDEVTYNILMNIIEKLKSQGVKVNELAVLREALKLYERLRVGSNEELLIELWDRIDKVESEIERLRYEIEELKSTIKHKAVTPHKEEKFLEFLKNMIVYPLDRIRKSRRVIERLVHEGIVEIIEASNRTYIVYKPKKDEFLKKLPIPLEEVKNLPERERRLVEVLKSAALIYEDAITRTLREVK